MVEISREDDRVSYRTSWVPNQDVILQIGVHLGLDFVHRYEELDMFIYGRAEYKEGNYSNVFLNGKEDYDDYVNALMNDKYEHKGNTYATFKELLVGMLDIKPKDIYTVKPDPPAEEAVRNLKR